MWKEVPAGCLLTVRKCKQEWVPETTTVEDGRGFWFH